MKIANSIKISVFIKQEEDEEEIRQAFIGLFPYDLNKEKIALLKTKADGIVNNKITIYEANLLKERHTKQFLKSLIEKLEEKQKTLLLEQEDRLDEECCFFIRLDKKELIKGNYKITEEGDCFHIKINIAAFPKKKENARKVVNEMFSNT